MMSNPDGHPDHGGKDEFGRLQEASHRAESRLAQIRPNLLLIYLCVSAVDLINHD